ncbi:MAG: hypothetical protein A2428_03190 [Bdellovibrionales bacterium RIFOXYC1_FULL_54_43]|nr:MAG: hypothetical protein A2428_03190 [Bdellovibrionales bacterium RIFOXYC1_FULL_54_43]OFZ82686.1 MAG: hypothetical protein A2603_02625 [Bdellovibrionales bacterium RIFOXYD1_FULL_55_31]
MRELFLSYALAQVGIRYKWGGNNPVDGFDCSGLIQWLLASVGLDPPGRQNAKQLYEHFSAQGGIQNEKVFGCLAFFGKSRSDISHVALILNESQMLESGGGDHLCLTEADAAARSACVKISMISRRSDLITTLKPRYPWVG